MWSTEILEGFTERIENIAVFEPLFDLKQKRKYDYSLLELGIAVLLFILEKMLQNEDCTYQKIARFIQQLIEQNYGDQLSLAEAKELTHYLVRDCLLNQGRPYSFEYQNYETEEPDEYKFHLVKLDDYQIEDRVVKLKLSTVGLELLFKTKEVYNELQVSISQLYLKQQIQKGVFAGALRSVKELKLAVRNEEERLRSLKERILRDVLQVAKEGEYEKELDRINDQLDREWETFQELMDLVQETLDRYSNGEDEEALDKVVRLKSQLMETVRLHESLFKAKIELENLMNKSMENMILNTFSTQVNFETEFLEAAVNNDAALEQLKQIVEPLFSSTVNSSFNLNRIFESQRLYHNDRSEETELWELEEEELRAKEEEEQQQQREKEKRYQKYLQLLVEPLLERERIKLSRIINSLKEKDPEEYEGLITQPDFYSFILQLHQLGEVPLAAEEELEGMILDELFWVLAAVVEEDERLAELDSFELRAEDDVIRLAEGYLISDFIIARGQEHGS